ncbi:type VI secretion system protein TssA [Rhizobium straminoryzae]|uniref:Type VI secretion system protein TssA n=1 Tax=Rhizobium straminoryzae TaxID=1387186 RepID=A0A549TFP2_9HYPH|nr:type VI secretion system protein TssA [Rhizobium straminoryzae]TRL41329.1 type VI secretion system protein TssA [Rhizobium straminoryzae]
MNFADLKLPISLDRPCGENIRENTLYREIYFKIKDARGLARAAERMVTPGENISLSPLWKEVSNLALQILASMSKDIEVLAWLTEAEIRLRGYAGLRDIYDLSVSLLEHNFDELHSIGNDDDEERFAPFAGLNGVGGEGTLIQAIRLTPLLPGWKFGQVTLWDYQLSQRPGEDRIREDLENAVSNMNVAHVSEQLATVNACITLFERMTEILEARCGALAPASSNTRNVLHEAAAALRVLAHLPDAELSDAPDAMAASPEHVEDVSAGARVAALKPTADSISSREEAFEILLAVARYFKKAEPHSPTSLSIETLVRRGRMGFSELLAELMPDAHQRQAVLTAAGINAADSS